MEKLEKIEWRNSWQNITVVIGDHFLCQPPQGVLWDATARDAKIRWPNGAETVEKIRWRGHYGEVNDMGHEYTVRSLVPCFSGNLNGVELTIDLDDRFKVDVKALGTWLTAGPKA